MTQTTETGPSWTRGGRPGQPAATPGAPPERLPVPTRQRRPVLAMLALVLVLGGAALSAFLVLNSGAKQSVLVLAKDVEFGHRFEVSDFREGQLSFSVPGPQPVRFGQLSELVGRGFKANVPIRAGTFLTTSMINEKLQVPAGQFASVGLTLPEGQYPAEGVRPGDKVKLLYTPTADKGVAAGGVKNGTPLALGTTLVDKAYVNSVGTASGGQGGLVLSLIVKNEDLTQATVRGLPIAAAANAIKAVTVVRLPDGTTVETGNGE